MSEPEVGKAGVAETEAEGSGAAAPGSLYEEELKRYRMALNRGVDHAYRRYGFVLYHSLDVREAVEVRKQMGFAPLEATDSYNLGVVAAEKGDYAEAIERFRRALEADPALGAAEYNLALALELSGDKAAAKKLWTSYLKREDLSEADRATLSQHVKELA